MKLDYNINRMLQQQMSRRTTVLIDWAVSFISKGYPKHPQDHDTIALFKSILTTIDSTYFKPLISKPATLNSLELEICQYYEYKLNQSKQTLIQGGKDEYTQIKALVMFKIILELAYVVAKDKCLKAVAMLDPQSQDEIQKIIGNFMNIRRGSKTSRRQNPQNQIKKLKQENKKLKLTIQQLRINQSELVKKNIDLQRKLRQTEYVNLQKDFELQQSNKKISQLQSMIRQISIQIFNGEKDLIEKGTSNFNLMSELENNQKQDPNSNIKKLELGANLKYEESKSSIQDENYKRRCASLQKECKRSQGIVKKYYQLQEMHTYFKIQVNQIMSD